MESIVEKIGLILGFIGATTAIFSTGKHAGRAEISKRSGRVRHTPSLARPALFRLGMMVLALGFLWSFMFSWARPRPQNLSATAAAGLVTKPLETQSMGAIESLGDENPLTDVTEAEGLTADPSAGKAPSEPMENERHGANNR